MTSKELKEQNAELLSMLEVVTATLRNVLLHYGRPTTEADLSSRRKLLEESRALIVKARSS